MKREKGNDLPPRPRPASLGLGAALAPVVDMLAGVEGGARAGVEPLLALFPRASAAKPEGKV